MAAYRQTPHGKEITNEYARRYKHSQKGLETARRRRYKTYSPQKIRAQNAVKYAVATHKIPPAKTLRCFDCHLPAAEYHHWRGYDEINLLNVIPLCRKCHRCAV